MKRLNEVYAQLRRKNKGQYGLIILCNFFAVLLITAYVSIMRSPTVLNVLPEGGDSRKQVMMIFVLAVIGCGAFTTYAAALFFRYKSREFGILMALGTARRQLLQLLLGELFFIAFGTCISGAILGMPFAWVIWQIFRSFIVDTEEMRLVFDSQAYSFAAAFSVYTITSLFLLGYRSLRRTNVIDIIYEQRKSEPVKETPRWYGGLGIVLVAVGGFGGYIGPTLFVRILQRHPSSLINLLYLPLIIGIYMILMHTVVRGWGRNKNKYKNIIANSMMKFEGKQTVRNMLVITVLIAGAYFASFYTPMFATMQAKEVKSRSVDYIFHYRQDQSMLTRKEIEEMAAKYQVTIQDWREADFANLGIDGKKYIDDEGGKFHTIYRELNSEGNVISEEDYNRISGNQIDIKPGGYGAIIMEDGTIPYHMEGQISLLTNIDTGKKLPVKFQENIKDNLATGKYILDQSDYQQITDGLTPQWNERLVYFNVKDLEASYFFAKALYEEIIRHSGPECEIPEYYDRVEKIADEKEGLTYWGDTSDMTRINYNDSSSSIFKLYWKYIPRFKVLDKNDFVKNIAVYLMLFIFIAILCFAAVLVIAYTRCLSLAMNHRQMYEDVRRLGGNNQYLYHIIHSQVSRVYGIPAVVGTTIIYIFYSMIMYLNDSNDSRITPGELAGLINCLLVILVLSIMQWIFYRITLRKICNILSIKKERKLERRQA